MKCTLLHVGGDNSSLNCLRLDLMAYFFINLLFQDIVLFLLENGADIDMFNNHNNTPFFLATESLQKEICQVK